MTVELRGGGLSARRPGGALLASAKSAKPLRNRNHAGWDGVVCRNQCEAEQARALRSPHPAGLFEAIASGGGVVRNMVATKDGRLYPRLQRSQQSRRGAAIIKSLSLLDFR